MPGFSHLRDQNFDLQRLELLTEDGTQALRVAVGQGSRSHVLTAVHVPREIGMSDAGLAQILELAVFAGAGKRDAVVNFRNLVQGGTGIVGDQQHAVRIFHRDDGPPLGDAFLGILRLILHHLLGRDVVRQRHG